MAYEGYPRYLDIDSDGVPVRQLTPASVPQVYRGNGKWDPYIDAERIGNYGELVSRERFEAICSALDRRASSK